MCLEHARALAELGCPELTFCGCRAFWLAQECAGDSSLASASWPVQCSGGQGNAMGRTAQSKPVAGVARQTALLALPLSHVASAVEATLAEKRHPHRAGAFPKASLVVDRLLQQAPAPAPGPTGDHADLVSRALAILAEEATTWQAREGAKTATRSNR